MDSNEPVLVFLFEIVPVTIHWAIAEKPWLVVEMRNGGNRLNPEDSILSFNLFLNGQIQIITR